MEVPTPIAGWFISWKIPLKVDDSKGSNYGDSSEDVTKLIDIDKR